MFITDQVVVVDLPKTASSHVRWAFRQLGDGQESGVHVRPGPALLSSHSHFWGTIRNPWDWYVSLWAYGCDHRGTLYQALTSDQGWASSRGWKHSPGRAALSCLANPRRNRSAWIDAYADVDSPECFRQWLSMIHDSGCAPDLGDTYAQSRLAGFAGLLSWRYLRLYCTGSARKLGDLQAIQEFDDKHCYITRFLRTERLESDLLDGFAELGRALDDRELALIRDGGRSNSSSRKRDASWYYDDESLALVARRDAFIAGKFAYEAPG